MRPEYVRQYLFNLARLTVTAGLTIGLLGAAAILLAGRPPSIFGNLLFLAAVLLPVFICVCGFEKKPLHAVGLTARRRDMVYFIFGMLWAAAWLAVVLWAVGLLTGRNDFWIALRQSAGISRLAHYLLLGFCEELFFRGYLFQNLFCEWPFWRRSLLSAAIALLPYSLSVSPNTSPAFLFVFLFGLLANDLVYRTGSIWMCVGLHGMWNLLTVSCFFDQGTEGIATPLFPFLLLLFFPLFRLLFDHAGRRARLS